MSRMVGAAFARHRLGRSSRGLSTCVPPIIREFVPAYALPAPLQSTSLAGLWAVVCYACLPASPRST